MSDQPEIIVLPVDEIQENEWNPNVVPDHLMAALVKNIQRVGFTQPILVRPNTGPGRAYEVIDGAHRLRAARAAGVEFVPCTVKLIDTAEAKAQTIAHNQHGEMDASLTAKLLTEINADGIPFDELSGFVGYTDDELQAFENLLKIDWQPTPADRTPATTPQSDDERWIDLRVRVPYSLALMFRSEIDRLREIRGTDHDHLALELMVLNSAQTSPENMG
jgi:hypothetical protein